MDPLERFQQLLVKAADAASTDNESKASVAAALKMIAEKKVLVVVPIEAAPPTRIRVGAPSRVSPDDLASHMRDFIRNAARATPPPDDFLDRLDRARRAQKADATPFYQRGIAGHGARCGRCGKILEIGDAVHIRRGFHPNCDACGPAGGSRL